MTTKRMTVLAAVAGVLLVLGACGGDGGPTSSSPVVQPPAPPPVSYSGKFTGLLSVTGLSGQLGGLSGFDWCSSTFTQTGNVVDLGRLSCTSLGLTTTLGNGTLQGNAVKTVNTYTSSGCGVVTVSTDGYFSSDGGIFNATVKFAGTCGAMEFRGEMKR